MQQDAASIPDAPLAGTLEALKRFNARRRLKATLRAVRAAIRVKILLAARMQRVMDAARASSRAVAAAGGEPTPTDDEADNLPVDQAILRALKAAEAQGMGTGANPAVAKAKAAEEEQERLLQSHLAASAAIPPPSPAAGGRPGSVAPAAASAAGSQRASASGGSTSGTIVRQGNPLMMTPALGVVHSPGRR